MTAPPALPDAEALLIGWLSEMVSTARVVADLPAELEKALPVVQITRIGGGAQHQPWSPGGALHLHASVDLDFYAGTRVQAADLALFVCSVLPGLRNTIRPGAVVTQVSENVGATWRPDYNPRVRRFGATYEITMRPE